MKPLGFIYVVTCLVNGKIYVGKHEFSEDKWLNSTYLGSGIKIKRAVNKYGRKNFKRKILKLCYTINQLNGWETYFIKKLKSTDESIGYNIALGGYGFRSGDKNPCYGDGTKNPFYGHHHTEETKRKIGEKNKRPSKLKGTKMSEESRRKMSEAAKKRLSDPTKNNMYGKHHSEEAKNKNRLSHLGRKHTEEAKRKMSIARKGKKHWWSTRKVA